MDRMGVRVSSMPKTPGLFFSPSHLVRSGAHLIQTHLEVLVISGDPPAMDLLGGRERGGAGMAWHGQVRVGYLVNNLGGGSGMRAGTHSRCLMLLTYHTPSHNEVIAGIARTDTLPPVYQGPNIHTPLTHQHQ